MQRLQKEIILYYRQHGRPLVDVLYPEQDVSNGNIQVVVMEGRLRNVYVTDANGKELTNSWTKPEYIRKKVGITNDEPILEAQLRSDLDWLNRNPFRSVNILYQQAESGYAKSDLVVQVKEKTPWNVFVGYEDTGSRITSEDRIFAGVSWGKAFGLEDHLLTYQFTANPGFDLVRAHSASYSILLPWRNTLRFFGSYVDVKGNLPNGVFLEGNSYQASMRYDIPLPYLGKYQQELSLGGDYKYNANNLIFNVANLNQPSVIVQAAASYSGVLQDDLGQTGIGLQGFYSPGGVTEDNSDAAFAAYRGAKAQYAYGRFSMERATKLPFASDWQSRPIQELFSWQVRALVQVTDGNLLPSEQLGLGGYATVRGYEEREANQDMGWLLSNELRTPALHPVRWVGKSTWQDGLQFLTFWDYGVGEPKHRNLNEDPHVVFSSVGLGLRYNLRDNLLLRFDYGWQLTASGQDNDPVTQKPKQHSRGHVGVTLTY
jgi:hemolysin activation/secretion protein